MNTDYRKGYEQALVDIQQEVYKAINYCTNSEGKITAKHLKKEIEVEVFPTLPVPVFNDKD
jgi:hypothetical protein